MGKQAKPSKLRVFIARVVLGLSGVFALLWGLSLVSMADATGAVIALGIAEIAFGPYLLFVAFFRPGSAAVQLLASFMDGD